MLVAGVVLLAGCGGGAAAITANASRVRYATTPTSQGQINRAAIPLGDGYVSTSPKMGYVDSCITHFTGGGAETEGPWIDQQTKTWNSRTKISVGGAVSWPGASYRVRVVGTERVIAFNDLPIDHTTGIFPIRPTDPAYQYDRNPNHIAPHQFLWKLPLHPNRARAASCTTPGPIGVLSDGVVLYNALDGAGRDAGAHEVLDKCDGHPDQSSTYHHHDIPSCILNKAPNGRSTLVGYASDGFGIYVQKDARGTLPTNRGLDACHGTTSPVRWDGKVQRIYHYVATLEYPYTIGCFRGTPVSVRPGSAP